MTPPREPRSIPQHPWNTTSFGGPTPSETLGIHGIHCSFLTHLFILFFSGAQKSLGTNSAKKNLTLGNKNRDPASAPLCSGGGSYGEEAHGPHPDLGSHTRRPGAEVFVLVFPVFVLDSVLFFRFFFVFPEVGVCSSLFFLSL